MLLENPQIITQQCSGANPEGQLATPVNITIEATRKRRRVSCPYATKVANAVYCLIAENGIVKPLSELGRYSEKIVETSLSPNIDGMRAFELATDELLTPCIQTNPQ
jgi:hypothetical protein